VHAIDIANELGFSKPSITKAMKILKENGYININEDNHIFLTDKGLEKAKTVYERHQTITEFWLMNGISMQNASKDACRMEHDISEETFLKIKELVAKNNK
jgi:Mn-dependent DtxR family transcriptional regulator